MLNQPSSQSPYMSTCCSSVVTAITMCFRPQAGYTKLRKDDPEVPMMNTGPAVTSSSENWERFENQWGTDVPPPTDEVALVVDPNASVMQAPPRRGSGQPAPNQMPLHSHQTSHLPVQQPHHAMQPLNSTAQPHMSHQAPHHNVQSRSSLPTQQFQNQAFQQNQSFQPQNVQPQSSIPNNPPNPREFSHSATRAVPKPASKPSATQDVPTVVEPEDFFADLGMTTTYKASTIKVTRIKRATPKVVIKPKTEPVPEPAAPSNRFNMDNLMDDGWGSTSTGWGNEATDMNLGDVDDIDLDADIDLGGGGWGDNDASEGGDAVEPGAIDGWGGGDGGDDVLAGMGDSWGMDTAPVAVVSVSSLGKKKKREKKKRDRRPRRERKKKISLGAVAL